jgi:hypothetical protein
MYDQGRQTYWLNEHRLARKLAQPSRRSSVDRSCESALSRDRSSRTPRSNARALVLSVRHPFMARMAAAVTLASTSQGVFASPYDRFTAQVVSAPARAQHAADEQA